MGTEYPAYTGLVLETDYSPTAGAAFFMLSDLNTVRTRRIVVRDKHELSAREGLKKLLRGENSDIFVFDSETLAQDASCGEGVTRFLPPSFDR
jgi:hypothetical protein